MLKKVNLTNICSRGSSYTFAVINLKSLARRKSFSMSLISFDRFNLFFLNIFETLGLATISNTVENSSASLRRSDKSGGDSSPPINEPHHSGSSKRRGEQSIFVSVCIERPPLITCQMNDLERRYSNMINEINIRRSHMSQHELRHLKDLYVID
jgi:hypothetical protein